MEEKLLEALDTYNMITPGMHICVCLSGGADSCALLHALLQLQESKSFYLTACHFNHQIRPNESDRDEQFCINLCQSYGVPLFVGTSDIPSLHAHSHQSMEEFARNTRYEWFEDIARQQHIDRFATAHHKDDQAETVLFRLFRGTTPRGLTGIAAVRDLYIRPLIYVSREEILKYNLKNNLLHVEDSSNLDTNYTRNYIRHVIIPSAEKINPEVSSAINRVSNLIREDNDFLESLLPEYAPKQFVDDLHDALLRRVIYRNFYKISKIVLGHKHLDKIFSCIKQRKDFRHEINSDWLAIYKKGFLYFQQSNTSFAEIYEEGTLTTEETLLCNQRLRIKLENGAPFVSGGEKLVQKKIVYNLSTEMLLSSDKICGMIRYRVRRPGDRFLFKGHHRSVKKMLCDKKIPLEIRSILPVLYDDIGILCIPFLGVSDRVYCLDATKAVKIQVDIASENV